MKSSSMIISSNKPAAANPAMASQLQAGRHWRGVGEPGRWAYEWACFVNMRKD